MIYFHHFIVKWKFHIPILMMHKFIHDLNELNDVSLWIWGIFYHFPPLCSEPHPSIDIAHSISTMNETSETGMKVSHHKHILDPLWGISWCFQAAVRLHPPSHSPCPLLQTRGCGGVYTCLSLIGSHSVLCWVQGCGIAGRNQHGVAWGVEMTRHMKHYYSETSL